MVACSMLMFLCVKIIPVFAEILADFNFDMPRSTRTLIDIGNYLVGGGWIAVPVVLCLVALAVKVLSRLLGCRGRLSAATGSALLRVPFVRSIMVKQNLARVSLVLERLLAGGVALDVALDDAASLDMNPMYRETMRRLRERVQNGETLKEAVEREGLLPTSFRGLVSIGDSSGLLPEAFGRIASLYRREALKTSRILMDVLTPIGVVALGCLTLLVTLSVFAILTSLYTGLVSSI